MKSADVFIEDLKYHPQLLPVIARWHHAEWLKYKEVSGRSANSSQQLLNKRTEVLRTHLDDVLIPTSYIALHKGAVIGSVSLVYYQFSRNQVKSPWVTNLYVCETFRRKGIGALLLEQVREHATAAGLSKLSLYTHDQRYYYEKRGWSLVRHGRLQKREVSILERRL